ncbi:MAG: Ig-like domain-containing protein [Bifidobacteriaceae bacterium]|nr:Ig-like domain-containing protein [Bifidobacteriaceae bacterium]
MTSSNSHANQPVTTPVSQPTADSQSHRPRWVRPVAMMAAAVLGITGLSIAQSLTAADTSQAVGYINWDGVMAPNQLWMVGTTPASNLARPRMIADPGTATAANFNNRLTVRYDKTETANGQACSGNNWNNLAMGPLLMADGISTLMHLGWGSNGENAGFLASGSGDCLPVTDLTPSGTGGWLGTTWGGEINQKTGEVYLIGADEEDFDGDSTTNDPRFNLVRVVAQRNGQGAIIGGTVERLARSSATPPAPGALNLAQAATAAGLSGTFTGNWGLGSDMAIDANGNAYRMARFARGGADYWALIRFNIPRSAPGVGQSVGAPLSTGWTYNVVKLFSAVDTNAVWGMAFLDGYLYTIHGDDSIYRWDPLAGSAINLGLPSSMSPRDLASAQMAPVIEGRVYRDVDGDGVIESGDNGLGGVQIDVWQSHEGGAPVLRGSLTTDTDGSYSALLPSASDTFYLRLRPHAIGGINASQSYASAGSMSDTRGGTNVVTALCASQTGDYFERSSSGACYGARRDGVDPASVTSPIAGSGGASTVSKVDMSSDQAVVRADFGLTTARSWGDAPDTYQTLAANSGPSAVSSFLYLGSVQAPYPDGAPGPDAAAHNATDDGLSFAPRPSSGVVPPAEAFVPAQGRIMAAGQRYLFQTQIGGFYTSGATARAWLSPLVGGTASSSLSDQLFSHTFGSETSYTAAYDAAQTAPAGGLANVYARARVDRRTDFGPGATALTDQSSQAWAGVGEVEDYRLAIANGVIRLGARTTDNLAAYVNLSLSNVSGTAPSSTTNSALLPAQTGQAITWLPNDHAVVDPALGVTINTTGVGPQGASAMNGWGLSEDTVCYNSATQVGVAYDISGGTLELSAAATAANPDITCELVYQPIITASASTMTVTPTPNQATPIVIGVETYTVSVHGAAWVTTADGSVTQTPVEGMEINLLLLASNGFPTTLVRFVESNGYAYGCELDADGDCSATVTATMIDRYEVIARTPDNVEIDRSWLYFRPGGPIENGSGAEITDDFDQVANHDVPGTTVANWGKQTIQVSLIDEYSNPVKDATGDLTVTLDPTDTAGLIYFANSGVFSCVREWPAGECDQGLYELDVYSAKAGLRTLNVHYKAGQPGGFTLDSMIDADGKKLLTHYTTPPVSPTHSTLTVSPSTPVDDPDDPSDQPDGVPDKIVTGKSYQIRLTAWDYGRNNLVGDVQVELTLTGPNCAAVFANGTATTTGLTSGIGQFTTTATADKATTCELTAKATGVAVGGSPKTLVWDDDIVDPENPETWFTVSTGDVVADGQATGTVTVSLRGENGLPITTSAADLSADGPTGGGVSVGSFTHQGQGIYLAYFTGDQIGNRVLSAKEGPTSLKVKAPDGNATAHFVAGPVCADYSWLIQPNGTATANGTASLTAAARLYDCYGHPVANATVTFQVPSNAAGGGVAGPTAVSATSNAAGLAEIAVTSEKAEPEGTAYLVTAKVGNPAVSITNVRGPAESTNIRTNGTLELTFKPGPAVPGFSELSIPTAAGGLTKVADGDESHRAEVAVKDAKGNGVSGIDVKFTYSYPRRAGEAGVITGQGSATSGTNGIAVFEFTSEHATTWTVHAYINDAEVSRSPQTAKFREGPPVSGERLTRLVSPGLAAAADGDQTQVITAYVTDAKGNPIKDATVTFAFPADTKAGGVAGPDTVDVTTDTLGMATVALTSTVVGTYEVTADATVDSDTITIDYGSPAEAVFTNAPLEPNYSVVSITTLPAIQTVVTEYHKVKVELFDSSHNLYTPATDVTFYYKLTTATTWTAGPTLRTSGGSVTWDDFTVRRAGLYDVKAEAGDKQLGTTQQCRFKAGPVDPVLTLASLTVSANPVAANGLASVPASMTAQDAEGNPVKDITLGFELVYDGVEGAEFGAPGGGKTASGVSGENGLVEVEIVSLFMGNFPVRGELDGDYSPEPYPEANFINDAPQPNESDFRVDRTPTNVSPDGAIADGSDSFTVTVTLRNSASVPINGVGGTVQFVPITAVDVQMQSFAFITGRNGNPTGQAQIQLSTLKAGEYAVRVLVGADPVATEPKGTVFEVKVTYGPGPVDYDLTRATFSATTGPVLSDDHATHGASLTVLDANSNVIKGVAVDFALSADKNAHFVDPETGDPLGKTLKVYSSELGRVRVLVASPTPETTHLSAVIGTPPVGNADFLFSTNGPSAFDSSWEITPVGTRVADAAEYFTATVTVRDNSPSHLLVPGASVEFEHGPALMLSPAGPYVTDANGQVQVEIRSTVAATHELRAKIGADGIAPDPRSVEFVSGPPAREQFEFFATPGNVLANGSQQHSAWVIAADIWGNLLPDIPIVFQVAPGETSIAGPDINGSGIEATVSTCDPSRADAPDWCDQKGKALVYLTSWEPGSFPVSAFWPNLGDFIRGAPKSVTFESGPADELHSSYAITPLATTDNSVAVPASGAESDAYSLTVTTKSVSDLLVPGAQVRIDGLDAAVTVTPSGNAFTGSPASGHFGTFTWKLTSSSVLAATGQVQVRTSDGWRDVGESFLVRFSGGPPDGTTSELTSPLLPARANGEGLLQVRATLRDLAGNAASCWQGLQEEPCLVTFNIPQGTWVVNDSVRTDGPAEVVVEAAMSDAALGAGTATLGVFGLEGPWEITAKVGGIAIATADGVTNPDGSARPAIVRFTDATPPRAPSVNPSNGSKVTGVVHEDDLADAAKGDLTAVVLDADGEEIGRCAVGVDGKFNCALPSVGHGETIHVAVRDTAGNGSSRTPAVVDAVPPVTQPVPSDGETLNGRGEQAGDVIVVRDSDGDELCRTTVKDDLSWSCELVPKADEGDLVTVIEIDPAENETEYVWRIGIPEVTLAKSALYASEQQTATGINFQPGEEVTAVMRSDPLEIGKAKADSNGKVSFVWTLAASTAIGSHSAELSGPLSGMASAKFNVETELPVTGSDGVIGLIGVAAGLLVSGWWLVLAARRRRREQPAT